MILYVVKVGVAQANWVRSMPALMFVLEASLIVSEEVNELFRLPYVCGCVHLKIHVQVSHSYIRI